MQNFERDSKNDPQIVLKRVKQGPIEKMKSKEINKYEKSANFIWGHTDAEKMILIFVIF